MPSSVRVCPRPDRTMFNRESRRVFAATCNRWGCKRCGSRKRDKLARRGMALHADGMLTTTISDARSGGVDATSVEAVAFIQERERVFRRHIQRVLGGFAYLWVVEVGEESGRVHRHYLVRWKRRALVAGFRRGWLPKWVLSALQEFAKSAGLGRIDWLPCTDEQVAARYVAKYVTKTMDALEPLMSERVGRAPFRRFGSNEHYDEPREAGWVSVGLPVETVVRMLAPSPAAQFSYFVLPDWSLPTRAGPLLSNS